MIQELAVGVIVVLAAAWAGARYLPAAWRRRIVFALSRGAGESRMARWLDTGPSCSTGCASCKACAPGTPDAASVSAPEQGDGPRVIKLHRRH